MDALLKHKWEYDPTHIQFLYKKLLDVDRLPRSIQTQLAALDKLKPLQTLRIFAQLVSALKTDETDVLDDPPLFWGKVLLANPARYIETDCQAAFLQYILWAASGIYMKSAFACEQKGESTHVKLVSKVGRALFLAEHIQAIPEAELCPSIAIDGTQTVVALFIELLRYKTRTKPPATLEKRQYDELLGILKNMLLFGKSIQENKVAHRSAKNWGKAVVRFSQIDLAVTHAHLVAHELEYFGDKYTCKETAQKMNLIIRLLLYANYNDNPLLHTMQSKLACGYINELPSAEKVSSFQPPELQAIKEKNVTGYIDYPSVFSTNIAKTTKDFDIQTMFKKIFDDYVELNLE